LNIDGTFEDWFAGSKVADGDGRPRMVFHGTSASFAAFDKKQQVLMPRFWGRPGFFFTSSADEAAENADWARIYRLGHCNIIPVYLRITNPVVRKAQGFPQKWFDANWRALTEQAQRNGNDGFIVNGGGPGEGRTTYIVFEPEQIVSAIVARAQMRAVQAPVAAAPALQPPTESAPRHRHKP
jgi:hypothetical protein